MCIDGQRILCLGSLLGLEQLDALRFREDTSVFVSSWLRLFEVANSNTAQNEL